MKQHIVSGGRRCGRRAAAIQQAPEYALYVCPRRDVNACRDIARRFGRLDIKVIGADVVDLVDDYFERRRPVVLDNGVIVILPHEIELKESSELH